MKSFVIAVLGFAAIAAGNPTSSSASSGVYVQYLRRGGIQCRQNCRNANVRNGLNDCNIVNCPPAVRNGCQVPDCSLPGNILRLHPHPDPNFFYQCIRTDDFGGVEAIARPCACETVFSARVDEFRCVHPWEWLPDCPEHPTNWRAILLSRAQCRPDCEECGDGGSPPVQVPPTPSPPTPSPPGTPPPWTPPVTEPPVQNPPPGGDNGCQCPCMPCIWFPCMPCQSNCACNGNNNNNRVQNPIQQPQPPQWQPQPEQRQPWQPQPPQWQPEQRQPWQPQPPQQPELPQFPQVPTWPEQRDPWNQQPEQWHPEQRPHWFSVNEEEVPVPAETEVEQQEKSAEIEN